MSTESATEFNYYYYYYFFVLSLFLNVASVMSGVQSSAGRLFHTRGHTLDSA